ncbi:hypothetical protein H1Q63_00125 [Desmonostoc muscorum CCALA 125]|nr:hypothetical protein [Desmonostoc muscorum CCALA 125]
MTFHPQYLPQDMECRRSLIVTGYACYAYTHERKPRCRAIAFRRKTTFVTNKEVMRAIKIKRSDGNS